ncbi:selenium-binding protein [Prunus dulcis]|uniref:Selenium-binding protein n=1 Tax=Prunus dulcis TaxID=3755 RepID=A0A4Y1QUC2_PRUDU|nr:selenium-binding protein [Prunus dulcis]
MVSLVDTILWTFASRNRDSWSSVFVEVSIRHNNIYSNKQCNSFKTRANQVKGGLEKGVPGITVLINPDKPRRGCFEIREEGGETFISLLGMKRPFKPMKDLNMEEIPDLISSSAPLCIILKAFYTHAKKWKSILRLRVIEVE